jgi:uncharacterized protein YggL (DUF469 family)
VKCHLCEKEVPVFGLILWCNDCIDEFLQSRERMDDFIRKVKDRVILEKSDSDTHPETGSVQMEGEEDHGKGPIEGRASFERWLEEQPYHGMVSEGTIRLMERAWDAGATEQVRRIHG